MGGVIRVLDFALLRKFIEISLQLVPLAILLFQLNSANVDVLFHRLFLSHDANNLKSQKAQNISNPQFIEIEESLVKLSVDVLTLTDLKVISLLNK